MGDMTRTYHFTNKMVKIAYGKYNGKRESLENTSEMRKRNTASACLPTNLLSLFAKTKLHCCDKLAYTALK